MEKILAAILRDDRVAVKSLLNADPELSTRLIDEARLHESAIFHWIYVGDTALHLTAAGYRVEIAELLLTAGSDPNSAMNRRQSGPLHYAADGYIAGPEWDPKRQVKTIRCLLDAGAKIDAQDKNGATPLHRAVRTRCSAAVQYFLKSGSDPNLRNKSGSTAFHLAVQNTGRGGTGTDDSKSAQRQIIKEFLAFGVSSSLKDGNGKSVLDCAKSGWILEMLS